MKNKIKGSFIFFLVLVTGLYLTPGCKKDILLSKENLLFSKDTVVFDTVFTTIGSTTNSFKIYNPSNRPIIIEEIRLMGGQNSPFRINVDGEPGVNFQEMRLPGKDSLFTFVEVTLGENNSIDPLIIEDSILFRTNGVDQYVVLAACGQDAYFHYNDLNSGTWPNDKPHVIYGYAAVDSAETLIIPAGTIIHLHKNSLIYVYKSTLQINGELNNKVEIQGDRLEAFYDDVKGQYYGIYFHEAKPSLINHAIIKNGTSGIHVYSENENNMNYTLEIKNSEIYNHASYGIFNYAGGRIKGDNLLVHSNGYYGFFLLEGGDYNFTHCHFLGFGSDGGQPAVAIKNYFTRSDGITYLGPINEGTITNSVLFGDGGNQLVYDTLNDQGVIINFNYSNNLIRLENPVTHSNLIGIIWNENPLFNDLELKDYKYSVLSPLNNNANPIFSNLIDIEENTRSLTNPDIGVYEID